jgi:type I restriction enzyme R subunit
MSQPDYWSNKLGNPHTVLATQEQISAMNDTILHERATCMNDLAAWEETTFDGVAYAQALQDAADAVCGSLEDKKTFSMVASELIRLMKYANKEDITDAARKEFEAIRAIYGVLQKKRKHVDTIDLMVQINAIIGQYVKMDDKSFEVKESRRFDISKIDFDLLRREFARARRKNLMLKDLQEVIQAQLDRMLFNNPDRINFYERYQQIIADYNGEQDHATIEKTFMELMALANSLEQEEQRYIREGFESDEELSLYDLLFKHDLS